MADAPEASISSATELLAAGRRNLAVRDYNAAAEALAKACEILAKEHGDTADECAEAYLWYGKALLGLSREESGVLGDGVPGTSNGDDEESDDNNEDQEETAEEDQNGQMETETKPKPDKEKENAEYISTTEVEVKKIEAESTTKDDEPSSSLSMSKPEQGTSNGQAAEECEAEEVDNLQLAWEMLELARGILVRRGGGGGGALLADALLALGEVALESETYDKAVLDMMSCLEIQKDLYPSDDRRIAETHYQIGLANSLASNFEDAITHFKNAANILETRIKSLENVNAAEDATVKKYSSSDPLYSIEGEIKELKELLPEIHEKIQDMMDYKAETRRRVRETLLGAASPSPRPCPSDPSPSPSDPAPSRAPPAPAADISHLVRRKRKASGEAPPAAAAGAKRPHS